MVPQQRFPRATGRGVAAAAVVRDATAGAKVPEGDGYLASLINFRMIANALWTTDKAVSRMAKVKV